MFSSPQQTSSRASPASSGSRAELEPLIEMKIPTGRVDGERLTAILINHGISNYEHQSGQGEFSFRAPNSFAEDVILQHSGDCEPVHLTPSDALALVDDIEELVKPFSEEARLVSLGEWIQFKGRIVLVESRREEVERRSDEHKRSNQTDSRPGHLSDLASAQDGMKRHQEESLAARTRYLDLGKVPKVSKTALTELHKTLEQLRALRGTIGIREPNSAQSRLVFSILSLPDPMRELVEQHFVSGHSLVQTGKILQDKFGDRYPGSRFTEEALKSRVDEVLKHLAAGYTNVSSALPDLFGTGISSNMLFRRVAQHPEWLDRLTENELANVRHRYNVAEEGVKDVPLGLAGTQNIPPGDTARAMGIQKDSEVRAHQRAMRALTVMFLTGKRHFPELTPMLLGEMRERGVFPGDIPKKYASVVERRAQKVPLATIASELEMHAQDVETAARAFSEQLYVRLSARRLLRHFVTQDAPATNAPSTNDPHLGRLLGQIELIQHQIGKVTDRRVLSLPPQCLKILFALRALPPEDRVIAEQYIVEEKYDHAQGERLAVVLHRLDRLWKDERSGDVDCLGTGVSSNMLFTAVADNPEWLSGLDHDVNRVLRGLFTVSEEPGNYVVRGQPVGAARLPQKEVAAQVELSPANTDRAKKTGLRDLLTLYLSDHGKLPPLNEKSFAEMRSLGIFPGKLKANHQKWIELRAQGKEIKAIREAAGGTVSTIKSTLQSKVPELCLQLAAAHHLQDLLVPKTAPAELDLAMLVYRKMVGGDPLLQGSEVKDPAVLVYLDSLPAWEVRALYLSVFDGMMPAAVSATMATESGIDVPHHKVKNQLTTRKAAIARIIETKRTVHGRESTLVPHTTLERGDLLVAARQKLYWYSDLEPEEIEALHVRLFTGVEGGRKEAIGLARTTRTKAGTTLGCSDEIVKKRELRGLGKLALHWFGEQLFLSLPPEYNDGMAEHLTNAGIELPKAPHPQDRHLFTLLAFMEHSLTLVRAQEGRRIVAPRADQTDRWGASTPSTVLVADMHSRD